MTSTTTPAPRASTRYGHAVTDSLVMVRRNLVRMVRYPSMTLVLLAQPILFMLLFVFVLGGTLGQGIPGGSGRDDYLTYLVPGIVLLTIASVSLGTAVGVAMDVDAGIVDRFRTMPIARVSVLTGHVVGALIQSVLALVVVLGLALALGYRPETSPAGWLALIGVSVVISFALTWITVALGMAAGSVETASNLPMPLVLLPFLGSGFVPTASLPTGLAWFADHQPFTPMIETCRALLTGDSPGGDLLLTLAWSAGVALVGYLWARRLFNRPRNR